MAFPILFKTGLKHFLGLRKSLIVGNNLQWICQYEQHPSHCRPELRGTFYRSVYLHFLKGLLWFKGLASNTVMRLPKGKTY